MKISVNEFTFSPAFDVRDQKKLPSSSPDQCLQVLCTQSSQTSVIYICWLVLLGHPPKP